MVTENGVMRMNALLMNKNAIFPELQYWNYRVLYEGDEYVLDMEESKSRDYKLRGEGGKTTRALISLLEMDVRADDPMIKKLVKYYMVLLDTDKWNLDFEMAHDDIFDGDES